MTRFQIKKIPLLWSICILSVATMIAALLLTGKEVERLPFTPPPFEENAVAGVPDVPEGLGWSEVDAQAYRADVCGVVMVTEGSADLWFTNPESNSVWLKLRVLDAQGTVIGQTGILKPGEYVRTVALSAVPDVGETVQLKIMGYEPETYYSAGSVVLSTVIGG